MKALQKAAQKKAWKDGKYDSLLGPEGLIAEAWKDGKYDSLLGSEGLIAEAWKDGKYDSRLGPEGLISEAHADGKYDVLAGPGGKIAEAHADGKYDASAAVKRKRGEDGRNAMLELYIDQTIADMDKEKVQLSVRLPQTLPASTDITGWENFRKKVKLVLLEGDLPHKKKEYLSLPLEQRQDPTQIQADANSSRKTQIRAARTRLAAR